MKALAVRPFPPGHSEHDDHQNICRHRGDGQRPHGCLGARLPHHPRRNSLSKRAQATARKAPSTRPLWLLQDRHTGAGQRAADSPSNLLKGSWARLPLEICRQYIRAKFIDTHAEYDRVDVSQF